MRRKIKQIMGVMAIVITLSVASVVSVSAMDLTETGTETTEDYAEDTAYSMLYGNNLNLGTTKIVKLASNKVGITGLTQCHHTCSKVYLNLTLERKVNGTYSTYKSWSFTADNATQLSKDITVIVPSGYYYRVRGYHAAKDGSKESTTTLTSGILVK